MADDAAIKIALQFLDQATAPMQQALRSMATSVKSVEAQFLGATAVARGFIGTLTAGAALNLGMEYENAVTRMKNVFQGGAAAAIESMEALSERSRHYFDFTELAGAAVRVQDTFENMRMGSSELETTLSRVMDIARAKGLDLEETVVKLNSAFMGAAKSGRQLGLNISDSYMQYEAFGGKLKEVWDKLGEGDKYWWRYQEFLLQSAKYSGMAAKETTTLSGSLKVLSNSIKDELEVTFAGATGYLTQLINWLVKAREINKEASEDVDRGIWKQFRENAAAMGIVRKPIPSPAGNTLTSEQFPWLKLHSWDTDFSGPGASYGLPEGADAHMTPIKGKGGAGEEAWKRILEEGKKIEAGTDALAKYNAELDRLKWFSDAGALSQEGYAKAVQNAWTELVKAESQTEGWVEFYQVQEEGARVFEETRTNAERYALEIERLNYLLGYGVITQDVYNRQVENLGTKFGGATDKMTEFALQAARNIQDTLGDQLYNVLTGNFDNIGTQFGQMLAKMAAQAIASDIASKMFGDFGTTKKIGGWVGDLFSWVGTLWGGGKASGGSVYPGTSYLVGEKGPEIFVPGSGGTIIPNGGGVAPSVIINIKNETGAGVTAEQSTASWDGEAWVAAVTLKLARNNEGYRSGMRQMLSGR